jgi:hypothetical protein
MTWVLLVALIGAVLAVNQPPPVVPLAFDSAARAVGEVARALGGTGRGLRDPYPEASRPVMAVLRHLPPAVREAVIGWGMRFSVGYPATALAGFDPDSLFSDYVRRYPNRQYPAIVLGSPGGGVAHLAALLDAPFLPVCALIGIRHEVQPDALAAYAATARAARELAAPGRYELIVHYDPIHDRDLVAHACLIRIRLLSLPRPYREFIGEHLAPGGTLILTEGTYPWPQAELGDGIWLQIGGLGGIGPEDYLAHYPPPGPMIARRESEWGCPDAFAQDLRAFAAGAGITLVEVPAAHPTDYSELAYRAYRAAGGRDDVVILDCFTSLDSRFCKRTGIPPLHLPFGTEDALLFAQRFLAAAPVAEKLLLLHPTFARPPDWVPLARWREVLGEGTTVLVDERYWPDDPYAPFAAAAELARREKEWELARPLRLPVQGFLDLVGR